MNPVERRKRDGSLNKAGTIRAAFDQLAAAGKIDQNATLSERVYAVREYLAAAGYREALEGTIRHWYMVYAQALKHRRESPPATPARERLAAVEAQLETLAKERERLAAEARQDDGAKFVRTVSALAARGWTRDDLIDLVASAF